MASKLTATEVRKQLNQAVRTFITGSKRLRKRCKHDRWIKSIPDESGPEWQCYGCGCITYNEPKKKGAKQ